MTRNWGYPQLGPNFLHIPGIPQIPLGEIHEISSISVRFLEILLVLDEFQDVSLNSVGFQKNSEVLTDIGGNFKISKNLTDISENFKNFKKSHRYQWEIKKNEENSLNAVKF